MLWRFKLDALRPCQHFPSCWDDFLSSWIELVKSSTRGNDRSPGSHHNVWRHHNLRCSKAGNFELETMIRNIFKRSRNYASSGYLQVNYNFQMLKAAYSVVSDGTWTKFKLIYVFMYVLVTYKKEEDHMKNERTRVVKTLYRYILDAQGQLTLYWWSGVAEKNQTHSIFYGCPCFLQEWGRSIQKWRR